MIEENKNTQTNPQPLEETVLFYYYGSDGQRYYTGNSTFALSRAEYHGTDKVYVEKR